MSGKTEKLQGADASAKGISTTLTTPACVRKLEGVQRLATDLLSRLDQLIQDDARAVVSKPLAMLPREIEDNQTYFLQKIHHARDTLLALGDVLQLTRDTAPQPGLISIELAMLFVLIENYRPERLLESGWNLTEEERQTIRERFDSINLDIFNMRERLK